MHGGTNSGAPRGNRHAWIHGNRSAETQEQLKAVRSADRTLRILGKADRGLKLTLKEREWLEELYEEQHRQRRLGE